MLRSARHLLVASLIALHAAVTVCGAGLHSLPGLGHDAGLHPRAKNDHSHGPGKSSHEATDECSVCQFFAQGQLPSAFAVGLTGWLSTPVDAPASRAVGHVPPRGPAAPRGPPAASA